MKTKILKEYCWTDNKISIFEILQILKENNISIENAYVELIYSDPYDENPAISITTDDFNCPKCKKGQLQKTTVEDLKFEYIDVIGCNSCKYYKI